MNRRFYATKLMLAALLFIFSCIIYPEVEAQKRILFVTSNQEYYGNTKLNTSNHFEEIVVPYDIFRKAGFAIDVVSPKGGAIPVGYINTSDSIQKMYLYDGFFMDKLEHTMKPGEIVAGNYQAIYYSGGGAAMYGVPEDTAIQHIARSIYNQDGVISAICHGTAGIVNLRDENGQPLYSKRKITGYPDTLENRTMDYYKAFPFSIDKAIESNGGNFVYAEKRNSSFYIVDGRFVTGQDPSAAPLVANEIVAILNRNFKTSYSNEKSDLEQITETLMDYIEGTANGQPERLRKAFHPSFNLYTIAKDTLWTRSGEQYIANIKPGEKSNRIGRMLYIDFDKDAAIAKAEIIVPGWRSFTDYFLLLKYSGSWKIVHKSYSFRELAGKVSVTPEIDKAKK